MKRLRKILQSNVFIILLIIFTIVYVIGFTKIKKYKSIYTTNVDQISGKIISIRQTQNSTYNIIIKAKQKVLVRIEDIKNAEVGNTIVVQGEVETIKNNTIPGTFNYKKYLYNNKIYTVFKGKIIYNNNKLGIITKLKNSFIRKSTKDKYHSLFIAGDKTTLEQETYESYQSIGVAHLLAISGMHAAVFVLILEKVLFLLNKNFKRIIILIILFIYLYLIDYQVSFERVCIMYALSIINDLLELKLSSIKRLFLSGVTIVLINPFAIYNLGFIYSYTLVSTILLLDLENKRYIQSAFVISVYTFLSSLLITTNANYEINLLSIASNLILIPLVTFVIYPTSLISFAVPFLDLLFNKEIWLLEKTVHFMNQVNFTKIIFPKVSVVITLLYMSLVLMSIIIDKKCLLIVAVIMLFIIKSDYIDLSIPKITMLDVGQGDLMVIKYKRKTAVMIDTGGQKNDFLKENIITYLKSQNIEKISHLILSHGDFDHMGEAIKLVQDYKVENVIFNCGTYNKLENDLIKVLDKKKIKYYSCIKELKIDNYNWQFLGTKEHDNENDNSNVIYFNYHNYKFLFMGDAGIEKEKNLLEKYYLKDIDFLKVGHHGSNTSSNKYFIDRINPKHSLISVGKNNRYGHPKDEVLDTLKNSKIYRTDLDGSIEIKLNKNGYKIRTCPP